MRVVVCIQARLNSVRLPGKVLREINGLPLIVHLWRRMLACREADGVVVSWGGDDAALDPVARRYAMAVWDQKDERDLLRRHFDAGGFLGAHAIVRTTADCLFHDPAIIDAMIREYRDTYPHFDAVVNWHPRTWSEGCDAEVISMAAVARMDRDADTPREGFATYMVESGKYRVKNVVGRNAGQMSAAPYNDGDVHLSIDTPEDVKRAEAMLAYMGSNDVWAYDRTMEAYRAVTR